MWKRMQDNPIIGLLLVGVLLWFGLVVLLDQAYGGVRYTPHHGEDVWADLAHCESGHGASAFKNRRYRGIYQFSYRTWASMDQRAGDPATHTPEEQLHSAMELQARSGWGQWPACSRAIGLR